MRFLISYTKKTFIIKQQNKSVEIASFPMYDTDVEP